MYSIGIDAGSTYTKGVLFDGENISKKGEQNLQNKTKVKNN